MKTMKNNFVNFMIFVLLHPPRLKRTGVGSAWDLLSESLKIARRHPVALFIPNQLTSCKRPSNH
jgi:hypothetical protein